MVPPPVQHSLPGDSDNRGLSQCAPTVAAASIRLAKSMAPNIQLWTVRGEGELRGMCVGGKLGLPCQKKGRPWY